MPGIKPSIFHLFSLGYVVEDNHMDCFCEPIIKVLPLEYMSNEKIENLLSTIRREVSYPTSKTPNSFLNDEHVKVEVKKIIENSSNTLDWKEMRDNIEIKRGRWMTATWSSFAKDNEYNAPCLNRGDIVMLFRYSDMDAYFWETLFKRTKEEHKTGDGSIKRYIAADKNRTKIEKEVTVNVCTNNIAYKVHSHNYTTNIFNYFELENGELKYIDQKGNMLAVNQSGVVNIKATKDIVGWANKNIYFSCGSNIDIAPSKLLSLSTKDIIAKASNGISIDGGHMVTVKGAAITLQGNVVINGNLAVMGSVVPAACPCCCMCVPGGGGGGSVSTPPPDKGYKSANKNANTLYNNTNKNRESFVKKMTSMVSKIFTAITNKVGKGN